MRPWLDPVRIVLDRVAMEHPSPAYISGYESAEWPAGATSMLVKLRLLVETTRATSATCAGCELGCHKPVLVRARRRPDPPIAYILCDEEPDLGRISVRLEHLRRFRASLSTAALFISSVLKLAEPTRSCSTYRPAAGMLRGRFGFRELALTVADRRVVMLVGSQSADLAGLHSWTEAGPVIDRAQVQRLANRKIRRAMRPEIEGRRGDSLAQRDKTAQRNREIMRHAKLLQKQGLSATKISEQIAQLSFITSSQDGLGPIVAATVRRIMARRARD